VLISVAVIVIGTELCALAMILLRNYRGEQHRRYHKSPIAGDVLGVIGTGFTVILAFVIFTAFDSYQRARSDAGIETVAVRQLASLTTFFPQPAQSQLQGDLVCYARAVISDEWPRMAAGGDASPIVDGWVVKMDQHLQAMPVQTNKEIETFNTWFQRSAERQDGRRGRLAEAAPFVPPFVWAMMVLLFVVVVGYQALFANPSRPMVPQVLGISAVSATLLTGIVLVYVLDTPFADRGAAIPPNRMQTTLTVLEATYSPGADAIPCDAAGRPRT
jgi:Protein of unknown function (DUF4239)